jgi:hypothetical protein
MAVVKPATTKADVGRGRRTLVMALIVVATLLGIASALTVWVKRQALDTNAITKASAQMLQNDQIRSALSVYLVDQLYANADVTGDLQARLPPELQAIAAPLAGGLRQLSVRAADTLLARPRTQQAFENAVRAAHSAFIRVINGDAKRVSSEGGVVYLDLRPLLGQLADQIGLSKELQAKLPPNVGKIEIMKQSQLDAIKTGARVIKALSVFLALAVLALYALAIFLARGYRRATLRSVGVAIAVAGVVLLLVRHVVGNMLVHTLASSPDAKAPGYNVWLIASSLLSDIAWVAITYGLVAVAAAILAGPTRGAVWIRRQLAPSFREHVGLVYTVVGLVYLLLILWGPTQAQRDWIWVLVFAGLLAVGTELFRRETVREFPGQPAP